MGFWGYFFICWCIMAIISVCIMLYEFKHVIVIDPNAPFLQGDITVEQLNKDKN